MHFLVLGKPQKVGEKESGRVPGFTTRTDPTSSNKNSDWGPGWRSSCPAAFLGWRQGEGQSGDGLKGKVTPSMLPLWNESNGKITQPSAQPHQVNYNHTWINIKILTHGYDEKSVNWGTPPPPPRAGFRLWFHSPNTSSLRLKCCLCIWA